MSSKISVKSYQGFEEGEYVARKGRLCQIKKIHFEMNPPSVTVKMMDNDCEVGTEFDRIQRVKAWFCSMCTAQNDDARSTKCCFCGMSRNYKEKITVCSDDEVEAQPLSKEHTMQITESEESEHSEYSEQDQSEADHALIDADNESAESDNQHRVEPQYENESEEETDEEPQPAMYRPHRSPFFTPNYRHSPFERQHRGQSKQSQRRQRPQRTRSQNRQQSQFPTFWPSYSLFDW